MNKFIFFYVISLLFLSLPSASETIRLAVAANFRTTLNNLVINYQQKYGGDFAISSASTGILYAQIKQGAPFDIFFSADQLTPKKLAQQLATSEKPFTYAHGLLVFWCPNGSPQTTQALSQWQGSYSIANPKLAPYGIAAEQAMQALNWPKNAGAIMGNNVSQVAQFIITKSVECGFLAKSLIDKNTPNQQKLIIPTEHYQPIVQQALILPQAYKSDKKSASAKHFIHYIQTEARSMIANAGYGLPVKVHDYLVKR